MTVGGLTDSPVPWPYVKARGRHSPILTGDLVRAVRQEASVVVCRLFGVTPQTVTKWRKALGVPHANAGTHERKAAPKRRTATGSCPGAIGPHRQAGQSGDTDQTAGGAGGAGQTGEGHEPMTRLDAVREIVSAFDAIAQECSDTADEFEGATQHCREALAALGVTEDEVDAVTADRGATELAKVGDVRLCWRS